MKTETDCLLDRLLSERSVRMAFQPIVDLTDGSVFGYEALARGEGLLEMPGALFSYARARGKSWELEKTCRENALAQIRGSMQAVPNARLFLNVSPGILADNRFLDTLSCETTGFSPEKIVIELTEQECLENRALLKDRVQSLSEKGFALALDDFGAGNSGLKTLLECQPTYIKFDRDLVRGIDTALFRRQLVKSFVQFAGTVGTTLIAEGVETWNEAKALLRLGFRFAQGFLFQRPSFSFREIGQDVQLRLHFLAKEMEDRIGPDLAETLRDLYEPCEILDVKGKTCEELDRLFRKNTLVDHLVLANEGKPPSLVTRQHFYFITGGPVGYSLYQKKPASLAAKPNPLLVREDVSVTTLAELAMNRKPEDLYDPVLITDKEERILGTITMRKLIIRSKELETENALDCNPLSGLPGNRAIGKWIDAALSHPVFTLVYADLDHFKKYNDRYGFLRGDRMIRFTADLFREFLPRMGKQARLGHIGGDDFVVISLSTIPEETLGSFCNAFDERKRLFFETEDLERGTFLALNRAGEEQEIPLVTVSLAVILETNLPENPHPGVLSRESAALKSLVKKRNAQTRKSGFLLDRRRYFLGGVVFQGSPGLSETKGASERQPCLKPL